MTLEPSVPLATQTHAGWPQRACKLNKAKGKSIAQFGKINCFHPNSSTKTQISHSVWTISGSRPKKSVPHETLFKTWLELWSTKMLQNTTRQIKKYPRLKSSAELSSNIMPNSCVKKYFFPWHHKSPWLLTLLLELFKNCTYLWHFSACLCLLPWCYSGLPCCSKQILVRERIFLEK